MTVFPACQHVFPCGHLELPYFRAASEVAGWRSRLAMCVILASLSACATVEPPPRVVKVPIAVPCLDKLPESPAFLTDAAMRQMDDFKLIIELRADQLNQRQHISELRATLTACVK